SWRTPQIVCRHCWTLSDRIGAQAALGQDMKGAGRTMTKRAVPMFMVLVVVSLVASVAMAANEPIKIKRGTAVLDGSLDEFIAAQAEIARFAPPEFASGHSKFDGPQDQSVVAYALYDDEWFYIAANVT